MRNDAFRKNFSVNVYVQVNHYNTACPAIEEIFVSFIAGQAIYIPLV